jgi:selenocysteine lyase/cysteine desulfurase
MLCMPPSSATSRKFLRGPRGAGFLYARSSSMQRLQLEGWEPGWADNHGAGWSGRDKYQLNPTARRYQHYEMSMAAKVSELDLASH